MTACVKCGHDPDAVVLQTWTLRLEKRLESANARTVNEGKSRWRYAAERDEWLSWVTVAARHAGVWWTASAAGKRRVTITRHYARRAREIDPDNLVAGAKPLVDALVMAKVVHDDKAQWLELHVLQHRDVINYTSVVVEEMKV